MNGCTEKCWTPVPCPVHGNRMTPRGRDAGMYAYQCCNNYADPAINPRHLWDIHDETRTYTDPMGWAAHKANCELCGGTS